MTFFTKAVFNLSQNLLRTGIRLWDFYRWLEPEKAKAFEAATIDTAPRAVIAKEKPSEQQAPSPAAALTEMEPLPDKQVFRAMFERKFGLYGQCPLVLGGRSRLYTCDELYELLSKIREIEQPDPTLAAVYDAVLTVILRAHGEGVIDQNALN